MAVRILVVGPYPPERDGIASYAAQQVAHLRREGHDVEALSPRPSAAHHTIDLHGFGGALRLRRHLSRYDRVLVNFHPDVFYPGQRGIGGSSATSLGLAGVFAAAGNVDLTVHEINYEQGRANHPSAWAARLMLRTPRRILVHSEAEAADLRDAFGAPAGRIEVIPHGGHFEKRTNVTRQSARRSLDIDPDEFMFLSIGFIQPHKGFDRALRGFRGLGGPGCRLDIVGTLRDDRPEHREHLDHLRHLTEATPAAHLHEEYVSDEMFDRWLVAADVVVLPYREIWSSGVLERARLYDRVVLATGTGGLASSAGEKVVLVQNTDSAIALEMARLAGSSARPVDVAAGWDAVGGSWDPVQAAVQERANAARGAPVPATVTEDGIDPVAALAAVEPVSYPTTASASPIGAFAKRVVKRLTFWEVEPLVGQMNTLKRATEEMGRALTKAQEAAPVPTTPERAPE
ncbi:MAG: glycosyltransferase family 4 protein [Acidimicrobiia bacterium]|nr:glycosyltransferase family 4 protein [Acidimicrobiia bacterium]